ncbi:MAG: cysteine desulfurase [Pirellulaceae bacterium]|nr:cysteine desulfurase [Pirellulaceae bacterium]
MSPLNVEEIRRDFPILSALGENGRPVIYLDNAASTQRPRQVIEAMDRVYETCYANVHRSGHGFSAQTTALYEASREAARSLIGAKSTNEVIFTSGTTAGINLVARSWGDANLKAGDEILLSVMEHHSNIVPWQQLAARTGAVIRWIPVTDDYELDLLAMNRLLWEKRTKIVAVTAVSNVLGTINPVRQIVERAHCVGAKVLIDAAQCIPHEPTNVQEWGADFVAFSGHKMLGPSGIGILYGREELLEAMPPFMGGGSMIRTVTLDGFTPANLPAKFEAGTPPIAPAIGLAPAIEYLQSVGLPQVFTHEQRLARRAHELLSAIEGVRILGPAPERKAGTVSFTMKGVHSKDIAVLLDEISGIAVREGHHCAMPLHARFGIPASCRASFYLYNSLDEVEQLAAGVKKAQQMLLRKPGGTKRPPKAPSPPDSPG